MSKKINEIAATLAQKTPKQMRTLRNQLNNRIKSFEDENNFGKKLPKLSEAHALFGLNIGDCKDLLQLTKKGLKSMKVENEDD